MKITWPFAACLLAGAAASIVGLKLAKSQAPTPGNTTFVRFYSPPVLLTALGWLLVGLGLFLLFILAPMVYIKG